ncbi:ABC transporter permease [Jiangella ureilytica]|uniref:ABC transporter permease n=1 Tax=Jiangella ureilytica TaxID=2530374 RepID=A0A4R4RLT4_9ACTN|nr:ABC transporter permease [Jiangella ureilytica]TDC50607.1 ABC transporter permease [Jiangella ureilytica]
MGRYVVQRLGQMVPVVIGTTFLIYALVWALPGDPFAGKCGDRPCPENYVQRMTAAYNLDDPLPVQYVKYMGSLLTGDFGQTFTGASVADELLSRYPTTLKLTLLAIAVEVVVGIAAGVLAGIRRGGFLDNLVLVSTLVLVSVPVFVTGLLAQATFGVRLGWFPVTFDGTFFSLVLPAVVLGSLSLAFVARLTRANLVENLRADYVRTAIAKGLPRQRVVGVHTLRNSLIPVVTFVGADLGGLLGGAVVVEGIFNIPGVGDMIFRGINAHEGGTVTAAVTVLVLVFLIVNLLVDLLYAVLDPRIRHA